LHFPKPLRRGKLSGMSTARNASICRTAASSF
jgi:hypothetical protein